MCQLSGFINKVIQEGSLADHWRKRWGSRVMVARRHWLGLRWWWVPRRRFTPSVSSAFSLLTVNRRPIETSNVSLQWHRYEEMCHMQGSTRLTQVNQPEWKRQGKVSQAEGRGKISDDGMGFYNGRCWCRYLESMSSDGRYILPVSGGVICFLNFTDKIHLIW